MKTYPQWKEHQIQKYVHSIPDVDILFRRGDIRFFLLQISREKDCEKLFDILLHGDKKTRRKYLEEKINNMVLSEIITQILFFFYSVGVLVPKDINSLTSFSDCDILRVRKRSDFLDDLMEWIEGQLQKLETFAELNP
jgi:hypothetical protein